MSTPSITRPVAAPPAPAAAGSPKIKWIPLFISIAVGLAIFFAPTPTGLTRIAQVVLAITAFTAVVWATQVINSGLASILMMGLLMLAGVKVPLVLSGYGGGAFWVLLTVLFYGFAMKKTGLAERISYYILSLFPSTYGGILSAFFVIGFILALGIPSMTVRTAIMVPIAWALVQSTGLEKRSKGSALIILTTFEMAVVPGVAFLYGSLSGPVVAASFEAKHLPLTWLGYAQFITLPTLVLCLLILIFNPIVLRPEAPLNAKPGFARDRLRALGAFKTPELITAVIVAVSIVFWATDSWHHKPSFLIGMFAVAVFGFSGILKDNEISTGVSWPLLLFIGGIFGLANVIQEYKVTDWIAGFFVPIVNHLTFSVIVLLIVMAVAMYILRFLDPSSFIAISVLFLSVVDVTSKAGIKPIVLMTPIIIASVPFWMLYQNFWLAMGDGLTGGEAFTTGQQMRLANTYAVAVLVALAVGVGYWKLAGIL